MAAVAVRNAMGMLLVNAGDADGAGDDACAENGALTTGRAAGAASALVRPNREKKPPAGGLLTRVSIFGFAIA